MQTLYTMVGLPASGKSTYTETHTDCTVISTDAIRAEILGDASNQEQNRRVFYIAHQRIDKALAQGHDVIFDATNLTRKLRKGIIHKHKARHVAVYVSTDVETCKHRDKQRDRHVGDQVIENMSKRLTIPTVEEGFDEVIVIQ